MFGTSVNLGTIALVFVVGAFIIWPPQSRVTLFIFGLACAFIPVFGTMAYATARGLNALDDVIASLRGAVG